jgi:hypothetical protein
MGIAFFFQELEGITRVAAIVLDGLFVAVLVGNALEHRMRSILAKRQGIDESIENKEWRRKS